MPVTTVSRNDLDSLLRSILDPARINALVLVSCASDTNEPRIPADILLQQMEHLPADVWAFDGHDVSRVWSNFAPPGFHAYGGGVRVIWAGARADDTSYTNPIFTTYPSDDPQRTMTRVINVISRRAAPMTAFPVATTPPSAIPSPAQLFNRNKPAASPPSPSQEGQAGNVAVADDPEPVAVPAPVLTRVDLEAEMDGLRSGMEMVSEAVGQLPRQIRETVVSTIVDLLGGEADAGQDDASEDVIAHHQPPPPVVYSDAEQQFRWEVHYTWLVSTPEPERRPVVDFTMAESFLPSLAAFPMLRRKVLAIVCDILTDQVWDRRTLHQMKQGDANPKTVTRPDGSIMWRVHVQSTTASAARLHFWLKSDRTVELVHIGHHDDMPPLT